MATALATSPPSRASVVSSPPSSSGPRGSVSASSSSGSAASAAGAAAGGASSKPAMEPAVVMYLGFVHADSARPEQEPGYDEVEIVHQLFTKNPIKKIRKMHPLFARGSHSQLLLRVTEEGLVAELPKAKKSKEAVVFQSQLSKLVYVAPMKKFLYVLAKRPSKTAGKYNCHVFQLRTEKQATSLSAALWTELRRSTEPSDGSDGRMGRRQTLDDLLSARSPTRLLPSKRAGSDTMFARLRENSQEDSGDSVAPRSIRELSEGDDDDNGFVFADDIQSEGDRASLGDEYLHMTEEEERERRVSHGRLADTSGIYSRHVTSIDRYFHGTIDRKGAEDMLRGKPFGTFLVRVSESRIGYSLSTVLRSGAAQHFKICIKDERFWVAGDEQIRHASLEDLVAFYHTHQLTKFGDHLKEPCD
eukprot:m.136990 g.136990  ORF g.136990 m.136990 type:complete len:417 (+) comp16595_c0_seq2:493-1743(+)